MPQMKRISSCFQFLLRNCLWEAVSNSRYVTTKRIVKICTAENPWFSNTFVLTKLVPQYAWAKKNPEAFYKQPDDVQTGSYMPGDENGKDEFRWAAAELFRAKVAAGAKADKATAAYQEDLKANAFTPDGAWWGNVNMLAA